MPRCYVSLDGVSENKLEVLGYIFIDEDENTRIYSYLGDILIVDKSDPFIYVEDINNAVSLGSEAITFPEI